MAKRKTVIHVIWSLVLGSAKKMLLREADKYSNKFFILNILIYA